MIQAMQRVKVSSKSDDKGGFVTTREKPVVIYGDVRTHEGETALILNGRQGVGNEDEIETPDGERYRVIGVVGAQGAPSVRASVEKIEKPI